MIIERRLARIRRSVQDPARPDHWALWVNVRYIEPFGAPTIAIVVHFTAGSSAELGRASSVRRALRIAEKHLGKRRAPELLDVTPFLYNAGEQWLYGDRAPKDTSTHE